MFALARLWTWVGNVFVPLALGWAVYVRGGLIDRPPPEGVLVSRAYWGLLATLATGAVLSWAFGLYVRKAKLENLPIVAPPNTTFEDENARSSFVTWGTAITFLITVVAGLILFGVRYSESQLHLWEGKEPLQASFFGSRIHAHTDGCDKAPCYALARRVDENLNPIYGVNEYKLYITDGALTLVMVALFLGINNSMRALMYKPPRALDL
jgi:hypothetical protein